MRTSTNLLKFSLYLIAFYLLSINFNSIATAEDRTKVILLGDRGHHQPSSLFRAIQKPLASVGIDIEYSEDQAGTLNSERLQQFDALLIYANIDEITKSQEEAMLNYRQQAFDVLRGFPESDIRTSLEQLVFFVTERKK